MCGKDFTRHGNLARGYINSHHIYGMLQGLQREYPGSAANVQDASDRTRKQAQYPPVQGPHSEIVDRMRSNPGPMPLFKRQRRLFRRCFIRVLPLNERAAHRLVPHDLALAARRQQTICAAQNPCSPVEAKDPGDSAAMRRFPFWRRADQPRALTARPSDSTTLSWRDSVRSGYIGKVIRLRARRSVVGSCPSRPPHSR